MSGQTQQTECKASAHAAAEYPHAVCRHKEAGCLPSLSDSGATPCPHLHISPGHFFTLLQLKKETSLIMPSGLTQMLKWQS